MLTPRERSVMQVIASTTTTALLVIGLLAAYAFAQHNDSQVEAAHQKAQKARAEWAK